MRQRTMERYQSGRPSTESHLDLVGLGVLTVLESLHGANGPEFRQAVDGDADAILQIMSGAFAREPGTQKYERDRNRLREEIDTHWVLSWRGEVVGALHTQVDEIQVGRTTITKVDVGEVCVYPACQSEGLGTILMQRLVDQLKADGHTLSRLGGYRRFYERFGWAPFPRGSVEFPLQGLTSRSGFTDPVTFLDRVDEDVHIRPYDGKRDAEACERLYRAFNEGRTGARPTRSFGAGTGNPWQVVHEQEGEVRAYVFANQNDPPFGRLSSAVSISDAACDPAWTAPLGESLRYLLRQAAVSGAESVRARLPLDPTLYDLYRDASCGFIPSLWQSSEGGNMLQILSLRRLLEEIAPELAARAKTAGLPGTDVTLRVQDETVGIVWNGKSVVVGDASMDPVELGQDGLMKLILGLLPAEQVVSRDRTDASILRTLFPVQPTATGVWG
ncbi:MAG: hypothetical protein CME19_01700 [Gemmatimonadetes bacterium]|nr:hypothetical protein [Gemmatimonadota bacterium]